MLYGTNLTGSEVDYSTANVTNPTSGSDYLFVSNQDIDYLASKKISFVRLVISWECLQQLLNAPLATSGAYYTTLVARVNYLTSKGITVLIEPHGASDTNFCKYKGNLVGSAAVPNSAFADFWTRMAVVFKSNPLVMYGLSNEPHDMSTKQWFDAAQAAITGIRSTGSTQTIFVPGNGWTGAENWTNPGVDTAATKIANSTAFLALQDPANNLVASVHMYLDANSGGGADDIVSATIGVQRLTAVVNWAKANNVRIHLSEIAANSNNSLAPTAIKNVFDYIQANSSTIIGWSWWAYGPPAWWGGYRFTLCPTNNYTTDNVKWTWLAPYLTAVVTPPPPPPPPSGYLTTTYDANGFFHITTSQCTYVGYKPDTYSDSTPISLFVWAHGCGGQAEGDMWSIAPPSTRKTQSYIAISMGGRDGACWDVNADPAKVLAAIADVQKYFNINPKKIYMGGYSSGGDLTYRTVFYNSNLFAGALVENSSPFRDTGSTQAQSLAAAGWKFNVAHLAHLQDTTYPIAGVRTETNAMVTAGFPLTRIEKNGTHYDADSGTTGTNYDLIHSLLPFLDAGWVQGGTVVVPPPPPPPPPVSNIVKTSTTVKYPGGQSFTAKKVVATGDSVPAGTYSLLFSTIVTYSGNTNFCVDIVVTNDNQDYDISWDSLQLDLRGHTIASSGGCTITGTTGVVTVVPTNRTVLSKNKAAFNLCLTRATDATSYYQVLVKSVKL